MSSESERPACPKCCAIPTPAARGETLAFCAACDIAYSASRMIVAAGLRSFPRMSKPRTGPCDCEFKDQRCAYAGPEISCDKTFDRCLELGNLVNFHGLPIV